MPATASAPTPSSTPTSQPTHVDVAAWFPLSGKPYGAIATSVGSGISLVGFARGVKKVAEGLRNGDATQVKLGASQVAFSAAATLLGSAFTAVNVDETLRGRFWKNNPDATTYNHLVNGTFLGRLSAATSRSNIVTSAPVTKLTVVAR